MASPAAVSNSEIAVLQSLPRPSRPFEGKKGNKLYVYIHYTTLRGLLVFPPNTGKSGGAPSKGTGPCDPGKGSSAEGVVEDITIKTPFAIPHPGEGAMAAVNAIQLR